jgi:hypothetical protein
MTTPRRIAATLLSVAALATATNGYAATVVLDGAHGAVYDSVGDGWFFAGPSQPPPDGTGDAGNQALAVGLIANVLELRAMAEFGLGDLAGVDPDSITSAILTVTIDDVIGTFGPGANLDGTASTPIQIGTYAGNGAVTTSDFSISTTSLGQITPGVITDATLANTGAVPFTLDVTTALKAALAASNTSFGVRLQTADSPTATSLDDLGVSGAAFPFITVQFPDPTTTTTIATTTTTIVTTTTIIGTTTTSTTAPPTTTTSTTSTATAPPPSTTTTTVPSGCTIEATIESIRCRLDELADAVASEASLSGVAGKMTSNLQKAQALLDKAEASDGRTARGALRKVGTRLRSTARPLRSLKGRRTVDAEVRADLIATIDGLIADVKTVMRAS